MQRISNWLFPHRQRRICKPVFIVGCGRSGTTLLFQLLQQHPELAPTTGYPDGEDHVGWNKYGNCIISGLGNIHQEPGVTGYHYCLHMDEEDVSEGVIDQMTEYYWDQVLQQDASRRVLNKCGHLSNKLRYVRAIFPDAKFVHIVRDCLPTVYSWIKMMKEQSELALYWPDSDYPCFWVMPAEDRRISRERMFRNEKRMYPGGGEACLVEYWMETNRNIPVQLADTPDQLLTIRYEDFIDAPLGVLNQIASFCQLKVGFEEVPDSLTCGRLSGGRNQEYKAELAQGVISSYLERSNEVREYFGYV